QAGVPIGLKAGRELSQKIRPSFNVSQQKSTAVRAQLPPVKTGPRSAAFLPLGNSVVQRYTQSVPRRLLPCHQVVADTQLNSTVRRLFRTHGEKCPPELQRRRHCVVGG